MGRNVKVMNTNSSTRPTPTTRFGTLRSLGRGIAATSAVAVLGIGTMSAAEASSAGVSTGVRYVGSSATDVVKPSPAQVETTSTSRYAIRDGKLVAL